MTQPSKITTCDVCKGDVIDGRCFACEDKAEALAQESKDRARKWQDRCPKLFQDTDPAKLPCQTAYRKAMAWKGGPEGLLLRGPTRLGKSRVAWEVLRQHYFAGKSFRYLTPMSGLEYGAAFAKGAASAKEWADKLLLSDILLLDDVFKVKLTDAFESLVFAVVDARTSNKKPVIVTMNDDGKTLVSRFTADRGEPFAERLREFCIDVTFK